MIVERKLNNSLRLHGSNSLIPVGVGHLIPQQVVRVCMYTTLRSITPPSITSPLVKRRRLRIRPMKMIVGPSRSINPSWLSAASRGRGGGGILRSRVYTAVRNTIPSEHHRARQIEGVALIPISVHDVSFIKGALHLLAPTARNQ